jgi:CdiI immunity protein
MEGQDWPDLVRNYAGSQPQSELDDTAAELDKLMVDIREDAALDLELFRELGCSYDPRPDLGGPTVRIWLQQIAALLRAGAGRPS